MKKVYVEIYEILWSEATRVGATIWCSKQFQRIFFTNKAAQEFETKLVCEGLSPDYIKIIIHQLPVLSEEVLATDEKNTRT